MSITDIVEMFFRNLISRPAMHDKAACVWVTNVPVAKAWYHGCLTEDDTYGENNALIQG